MELGLSDLGHQTWSSPTLLIDSGINPALGASFIPDVQLESAPVLSADTYPSLPLSHLFNSFEVPLLVPTTWSPALQSEASQYDYAGILAPRATIAIPQLPSETCDQCGDRFRDKEHLW
jgi:hypothetical protein